MRVYLVLILAFLTCIATESIFATKKYYDYSKELMAIEALLQTFDAKKGEVHHCTKEEVEQLLMKGVEQQLNLFEILYGVYSYLEKMSLRISMKGDILRELEEKVSYGNERVYALIPISIVNEVQVGPTNEAGKHALDLFLDKNYEKYIEIGTAIYERHIGFDKIENNALDFCFGMTVKKIGIKKKIDRIVLYNKNDIAIYVKKFPIPKKWHIPTVWLK